jgi:hypothetical protein
LASADCPEVDYGVAADCDLTLGRFYYEPGVQYWLEDNRSDDISTRQTLLYGVAAAGPLSLRAGGGFWFGTREVFAVYREPSPPEIPPDWITAFIPFVELRAPLVFDTFSVVPAFRYLISAYRNYEVPGQKYQYTEPELVFDYSFTPRWGLEVRARYRHGVGNDEADLTFLEIGPRVSW